MIVHHEEIVPECKGCIRAILNVVGGKRWICACHPYPRMQWLCGTTCSNFFVQNDKDDKDINRNKI